jgi:hypothetical protein
MVLPMRPRRQPLRDLGGQVHGQRDDELAGRAALVALGDGHLGDLLRGGRRAAQTAARIRGDEASLGIAFSVARDPSAPRCSPSSCRRSGAQGRPWHTALRGVGALGRAADARAVVEAAARMVAPSGSLAQGRAAEPLTAARRPPFPSVMRSEPRGARLPSR